MPFLARLLGRTKNKRNPSEEAETNEEKAPKLETTKKSMEEHFDKNGLHTYKREFLNNNIICPICHSKPVKEVYVVEGPYFSKNGSQINALIKVFVKYLCGKCGHEESKRTIYIPLYGIETLSPFFTEDFKDVIQQIKSEADKYTDILRKVLI